MLYNPTFLYTFVFSISWLLNPAMYAYKYRLAFLSETNRWLSINYQTKKVCPMGYSGLFLFQRYNVVHQSYLFMEVTHIHCFVIYQFEQDS